MMEANRKCGNEAFSAALEIKLEELSGDETERNFRRRRQEEEKGERRKEVQENLDKSKCEKLDFGATGGDSVS